MSENAGINSEKLCIQNLNHKKHTILTTLNPRDRINISSFLEISSSHEYIDVTQRVHLLLLLMSKNHLEKPMSKPEVPCVT